MLKLKADRLLKHNIDALLDARNQTRHDLAFFCRRSDAWISKIMSEDNGDERNMPLKYLDRIADFFGIATYQLFQPGISKLTERRAGVDRRGGRDRRISNAVLSHKPGDVDLMDLIRALPRQDREDLIAEAADRLNKRLKRKPSLAAAIDAQDHISESTPTTHAPQRGRKSKDTT